ncbi:hypothetical protein BGX31_008507 [Mortierella sp. GBA43]|nr:hypothetical protein BGX31_008507 [Mortierella sp. GBA43]
MAAPTLRSLLQSLPIYFLLLTIILSNLMILGLGAPTKPSPGGDKPKDPPKVDNYTLDPNRSYDGLSGMSIPGAIGGVFMIITGLFLCFGATILPKYDKNYSLAVSFLTGFYFYGDVIYIIMVNAGVTAGFGLLVGTALIAALISGLRLRLPALRPCGPELIGIVGLQFLGLWVLCIKPGGLIPSRMAQIGILAALSVLGFPFIFFPTDHISASAGAPPLGAFVAVAGADFFARTGFVQQAESFINSRSTFNSPDNVLFRQHIPLAPMFIPIGLCGGFTALGLMYQLKNGKNNGFTFDKEREEALGYESSWQIFIRGLKGLFCFGAFMSERKRSVQDIIDAARSEKP